MKIIRITVLLLFFHGHVFSQPTGNLYRYIDFETFIDKEVKNDSVFMAEMYEAIGRYSEDARKNLLGAKIEVMVVNHGFLFWDFIFSKESCLFNLSEDDIRKVFEDNIHKREERYFTRFYIEYDLEPWRNKESAYHKKYQGLVNKNSFVKLGYLVPRQHFEY